MQLTVGLVVRGGKDVKETLEGIMAQDFPHEDMEIIVVIGGRKQDTPKFQTYLDSGMDIDAKMFYDAGKGLGAARQIVVDNARGNFIMWVDGDVILPKDFVRRQMVFMKKNPQIGVAIGEYNHREQTGKNVANIISLYWSMLRIVYFGATICRVDAIKDVGGFDSSIKGASEDVDLVLRLVLAKWKLAINSNAKYFHKQRESWKGLMRRGMWYGFGGHFIERKYDARIKSPYRLPPFLFGRGLRMSPKVYGKFRAKKAFFIPFVGAFFSIGWCIGFFSAYIQGYGHSLKKAKVEYGNATFAMSKIRNMLVHMEE